MDNCKSAAKSIPLSKSAPLNILKNGFYDTKKTVQLCATPKQMRCDTLKARLSILSAAKQAALFKDVHGGAEKGKMGTFTCRMPEECYLPASSSEV